MNADRYDSAARAANTILVLPSNASFEMKHEFPYTNDAIKTS